MRTIKFRGKNNVMWYYGDLVQLKDGRAIRYNSGQVAPVNADTVGQLTGLQDKEGKEVYEGDILENGWVQGSSSYRAFEVKWNDAFGGYFMPDDYDDEGLWSIGAAFEADNDWKVVGNVHDDPKFLQEPNSPESV